MKNNTGLIEKVTPIMPCQDVRLQASFYQALGFTVSGIYTSPNPYLALHWGNVALHFYGNRRFEASQNSTMCFLMVRDVDEVNHSFTTALKQHYGKIPRTGFPKITKVRSLVDDRRFTLTDPAGNTFYIGSSVADRFFRTLEAEDVAKTFTVLYDVLYSKEDYTLAASMLPKYAHLVEELRGLDKAKYLLVVMETQKYSGQTMEDGALRRLFEEQGEDTADWKKIRKKYQELLAQEE
ncbi:VOC family protein [Dawidia soli]|uniref:Uncharacterized protein n=1 Tax=Dawidia soli TaxID=2782352 RepID=A0AAP2DC18_9BACT|nr:hypothetical protein [Dawidia soli]MBT1688652.1 hypothetical protein [Dawidia soli]